MYKQIDKIRNNLVATRNPRMVFIGLALAIGLISYLLVTFEQIPYRLYNSDIYHQLAVVNQFEASSGNPSDPFFSSGPTDLHAGPFYYLIYIFHTLSGLSVSETLFLIIPFNVVFLIFSLYYLGKSFGLNLNQIKLLVLFSLFGWGSISFFFAGIYDYSNLLVTGSFPATTGLALMFLNLGVAKQYLETRSHSLLILFGLLLISLILSHILSGVIFLSFLALMMLERILDIKRLELSLWLLSIAAIIAIALTLFIWPPFSLLDLFGNSKTVEVGGSDKVTVNLFTVADWPALLGVTILGLVFVPKLIRDKHYLIILILLASAIMTASYMLPIRVSLYWRYFPFLCLALSMTLALYIGSLRKYYYLGLIIITCLLGVLNASNKITYLKSFTAYDGSHVESIAQRIPKNSIVLSDPNTSYHLAAFNNINVVSVPYNHANPAYIQQSKERYLANLDFLMKPSTKEKQNEFLEIYNVDYVVVNRNYYPDYIKLTTDTSWLSSFELKVKNQKVWESEFISIYKVGTDE